MSDTSITVIGTVGTEPEQRLTPNGPVTGFRLACNSRRLDKATGEWRDGPTSWFDISVWRGLGEHALRSLHTGERVIVSGRLQMRTWESGEKHGTSADITADAIGHDLRWGTTTFQRSSQAAAPPREWSTEAPEPDAWSTTSSPGPLLNAATSATEAPAPGTAAALSSSGGVGWATPGTTPAPAPLSPNDGGQARELVSADQTPF